MDASMTELIRRRVADAAFEAIRRAELELPGDYLAALKNARSLESRDVAQREYENIFENLSDAKRLSVPICQDTGMHIFYVTVPEGFPMTWVTNHKTTKPHDHKIKNRAKATNTPNHFKTAQNTDRHRHKIDKTQANADTTQTKHRYKTDTDTNTTSTRYQTKPTAYTKRIRCG